MKSLSFWSTWLMKESLEILLLLNCRKIISRDFQKEADIKQIGRFVILCTVAVNSARRMNAPCLFIWHGKPAGGLRWRMTQALTDWRSRFAAERSAGERSARLYPDIKEGKQLGRRGWPHLDWNDFQHPGGCRAPCTPRLCLMDGASTQTPAFSSNQLLGGREQGSGEHVLPRTDSEELRE